jgi:hypothetical protein
MVLQHNTEGHQPTLNVHDNWIDAVSAIKPPMNLCGETVPAGAVNCTISNNTVLAPKGVWSAAAQAIIQASGPPH